MLKIRAKDIDATNSSLALGKRLVLLNPYIVTVLRQYVSASDCGEDNLFDMSPNTFTHRIARHALKAIGKSIGWENVRASYIVACAQQNVPVAIPLMNGNSLKEVIEAYTHKNGFDYAQIMRDKPLYDIPTWVFNK